MFGINEILRLTQEDIQEYIQMKTPEEYTLEDAEMVICYGDIETIPYRMLRYVLKVWKPRSEIDLRKAELWGRKPEIIDVESLKKRIGKDAYIKRVYGIEMQLVKRVAETYATSIPKDMDMLVIRTMNDLVCLTKIIGEHHPEKFGDLFKLMALKEFEKVFTETLEDSLKGGVNSYLSLVKVDTDYYLTRKT